MSRLRIALRLLLALAALGTAVSAAVGEALATDAIVLPGFAPIRTTGTEVELGQRVYLWDQSFLPVRIDSRGSPLAGPMRLVLAAAGPIAPETVKITESEPDHALVVAEGEPLPGLSVKVSTRVEYDGVAMVSLEITPRAPVAVSGLDYEVAIARTAWTRMLRFEAASVRDQARPIRIDPSYRGPFQNAIGLADGDRSFWWFADNAEGWIWNGRDVTEVEPGASEVRIRQQLIGGPYRIAKPIRLAFNFLATPVRELGTAWREERVTTRLEPAGAAEGRFQLWWLDAFAHKDLPYTTPPASVLGAMPEAERSVYPGLAKQRAALARYRSWGLEVLPYFSAHCLSSFDPELRRNRSEWEVSPPLVLNVADPPFGKVETPCLSQRASGYSDYLLSRLGQEIDALGMSGLYFDQGSVIDSANRSHGAWTDSRGATHPSLDILALRSFFKRLREIFQQKGKPGFLFVHNSNVEITPAYTFVTSTVDGEQFTGLLRDDDYIGSIALDQVRTQFAPEQYGVLVTWLSETWYRHAHEPGWEGSPAQRRAFRNFLTLALLHDVPVWPAGAPAADWKETLGILDGFGVGKAEFIGYWRGHAGARTESAQAQVSLYRRSDTHRALLIVANLDAEPQTVAVSFQAQGLVGDAARSVRFRLLPRGLVLDAENGRIAVPVPARDFQLVSAE